MPKRVVVFCSSKNSFFKKPLSFAAFPGIEGEAMLLRLSQKGICVSTGSACTTGQKEPSHALRAMGVDPRLALSTIRFSLSRETTETEIRVLIGLLPELVEELRPNGRLLR